MKLSKQLPFLVILFVSCKIDKSSEIIDKEPYLDKQIKRAIINGYFTNINEKIGISIYQNDMYLLLEKGNEVYQEEKFMLHLIKEDNSFLNQDFNKNDKIVSDSLLKSFNGVEILSIKIREGNYKGIRIGQYYRDSLGHTVNIWAKQISFSDIKKRTTFYKNEMDTYIDENLSKEDFIRSLKSGKFIENESGYKILISENYIYYITDKEEYTKNKIMLHIVYSDNSFENLSFSFSDKRIDDLVGHPYSNYRIAKVGIPDGDIYAFKKIRIGQYNETGNIWAKEILIDEVFKNPLLTYNGQLE